LVGGILRRLASLLLLIRNARIPFLPHVEQRARNLKQDGAEPGPGNRATEIVHGFNLSHY